MRSYPASLKAGTTAATRAVLDTVAAANSAPTVAADAHAQIGKAQQIDLVVRETAGGTFDAKLWWYYPDADTWVEDLAVGTLSCAANESAGSVLTPSGATALYVEVLNFAAGARASAWLIGCHTI